MMTDAYHGLPTPRTTLRARYVSLLVWCKGGCQHQAEADLQAVRRPSSPMGPTGRRLATRPDASEARNCKYQKVDDASFS